MEAGFVGEVRSAFMAGVTRHMNWEQFLESHVAGDFQTTDLFTLRSAYMAGHTRHTNWETFARSISL